MSINVKKDVWYGTVNIENNKQTYGYSFKKKHVSNNSRILTRWYIILRFLVFHTTMGGVTKERALKFANRTCALSNGTVDKSSNHDIFTALSNCGVIYYKRMNKTAVWFANIDAANELLVNAK